MTFQDSSTSVPSISEESENYWAGICDGYKGMTPEKFNNIRNFLASRSLYFNLDQFHPDDKEKVKASTAYRRGHLESAGDIRFQQGVPTVIVEDVVLFKGFKALDYLHELYGNIDSGEHEPAFFNMYQKLCVNNPRFLDPFKQVLRYEVSSPRVKIPTKLPSEAGYTINSFKFHERDGMLFYDTGLTFIRPYGTYFELWPNALKLFEPHIYEPNENETLTIEVVRHACLEDTEGDTTPTPIAKLIIRHASHFTLVETKTSTVSA